MLRLKPLVAVILALSFLFFGYILLAQAQSCEPEYHYFSPDFTIENSEPNLYFEQSAEYWYMICSSSGCDYGSDYVSISQAVSWAVVSTSELRINVQAVTHGNGTRFRMRVHFTDGSEAADEWRVIIAGGEVVTDFFDLSAHSGKNIDRLFIDYIGTPGGFSEQYRFYPPENRFSGCDAVLGDNCPLVESANFITSTNWLLAGGSVISDGVLLLPNGGQAAQNLSLSSLTAYNAVLSTTGSYSGSTSVDVTLGTQSQTVAITGAGRFTASFTTPSLGGPIAYGLENTGPDTVDLDFTCVSTDSSTTTDGECIAPINGEFNTAENWTFLRGAQWNGPSGKALLPYPDVGLIVSSSTYSLPVISGTENLLIGFDARKTDNNETGAIMGRVYAGSSVNWTFEAYGTEYRYETSLNTLAGLDNAEIAFVNPGLTGSDLISSTSDVVMDNVCVFIANRGPNLPTPLDPDGIPPVDLGFNYTSCDDVDGILAYFGVNIQQYRTDYLAGTSVWDPIGWVPWLIAAGWNILATWLCVFLAAFVSLVDLLQYFVNLFLNILNWMVRSFPGWRDWIAAWLAWLGATLANLSNAYAAFLASWSNWIGSSLANLSDWIGNSLANLSDGLAQFLANWSDWIATSLANLSDWIGAELAAWSDWIGTSLSNIAGFLNGSSETRNELRNLWNLLVPFLNAVLAYIAGSTGFFSVPLVSLLLAVISLVLMVVSWVWANIFLVVSIPINFYYAFDNGIKSEAFAYLMSCAETNFWCQMLAGIQLVNQTSAHTLMYPIVIVGIIIGSIVVFWKELWALFSTPVS